MKVAVFPLDASRRDDFYRIHSLANHAGWCFCVSWWTTTWENWGSRTGEENRALREQLFGRGVYDGYLLYVDGEAAGWCQCSPRDQLKKLLGQYRLKPDPEVWAVTCLMIAPPYRGQGLAHKLLEGILKDLKRQGVRHVQGFPRRGDNLAKEDVWTGPEVLFQRLSFKVEKEDHRFPVYGKWLEISTKPE